jgi:hypothetical protein
MPVPPAAPMTGPRLAGAPISWGVCEVPGWGYRLSAARVLADMRRLGLTATELGPDGFPPQEPAAAGAVHSAHHLTAVGGFTPVLLHVPGRPGVGVWRGRGIRRGPGCPAPLERSVRGSPKLGSTVKVLDAKGRQRVARTGRDFLPGTGRAIPRRECQNGTRNAPGGQLDSRRVCV